MNVRIVLLLAAVLALAGAEKRTQVPVRSRLELFKGSGQWQEARFDYGLPLDHTAIVVCDMWDKHWCRGASQRVGEMVPKANAFLKQARAAGLLIVHAPSETMDFYKSAPQRLAFQKIPKLDPPTPLDLKDPVLPVDSADGGCDTPDRFYKAWTRQHAGIEIGANDYISDNGQEIYNLLKLRGVTHLLVMGVHTNMCILNRSFAIRSMTKWGMKCLLIRDLTDSMYDPNDAPHVSHDRGTALIVEHIEKYWAPTLVSADLLKALH